MHTGAVTVRSAGQCVSLLDIGGEEEWAAGGEGRF